MFASILFIASCGGSSDKAGSHQCDDGKDNDGDGLIDFPDDPGCTSPTDDTEDSLPSPQCSDGRDNDGDGKIDFPNDPGCTSANQDSETDDCPDGPNCPQCGNGKDDDGNGLIDYPDDPGCTSASDPDEFTDNPAACGNDVMIEQLPIDGHVTGTLDTAAISHLMSPTCGGGGGEHVYELRINSPKVVTATTDFPDTAFDTVLYVRTSDCANNATEVTCNDDDKNATTAGTSTLAVSLTVPGVYYLVLDAHDAATGGAFDLQVDFLNGEGESCDTNANCGTGLVCRVPLNGTAKVCAKHVCSDGVDDDGDGKLDYPDDPGCDSPDDDDETDDCPSGPNCPQCANGIDDDHDGEIDYPNDTNCVAASWNHESCIETDTVTTITTANTAGTTVGLHNDTVQACGDSTSTAPDKDYKLTIPMKLDTLTITTVNPSFDAVTAAYGPSCGGTALDCEDSSPIQLTNVAAGDIYVTVDGYFAGDDGTFTLNVAGTIKNNESCEGTLVTAGVLTCGPTATCTGTAGSKKCVPAQCSDGLDNNGDGKIDYPADPGCDSPTDNTETTVCPGANCPVCSDGVDNDTDGKTDYAQDLSCWAASGTTESFCNAGVETDHSMHISSYATFGDTTNMHNDYPSQSCQSDATGNDVAVAFILPVPVTTITFDTLGSSFDTVLSLRNATCATEIACDDDDNVDTTFAVQSVITQTNLAAGTYALIVDGYSDDSGPFVLHAKGKVANGTACTSPLFAAGVLTCTGTATCTGGTCH